MYGDEQKNADVDNRREELARREAEAAELRAQAKATAEPGKRRRRRRPASTRRAADELPEADFWGYAE